MNIRRSTKQPYLGREENTIRSFEAVYPEAIDLILFIDTHQNSELIILVVKMLRCQVHLHPIALATKPTQSDQLINRGLSFFR